MIKPAIIAAAELVLHRKQDKTLDESLPISLQTSQMTVYPELVFQVSILRDKIDSLIVPNKARFSIIMLSILENFASIFRKL